MRNIIRIPAALGAQYSFFTTEDGEVYSGGGSYETIADFSIFMGGCLEDTLKSVLTENRNRIISLVIITEKLEYDEAIIVEGTTKMKCPVLGCNGELSSWPINKVRLYYVCRKCGILILEKPKDEFMIVEENSHD